MHGAQRPVTLGYYVLFAGMGACGNPDGTVLQGVPQFVEGGRVGIEGRRIELKVAHRHNVFQPQFLPALCGNVVLREQHVKAAEQGARRIFRSPPKFERFFRKPTIDEGGRNIATAHLKQQVRP